MEQERYYTSREAADYLGIPTHRLYGIRAQGTIPSETIEKGVSYRGSKYRFKQGDLDKWRNRHRNEAVMVLTQQDIEEEPLESDEGVMHKMLTALHTYLRQFEYAGMITTMRKVDTGTMQLWAIETKDVDVHVVVEGGAVQVISPQNQKYLELMNSELLKRLKTAETLLAFMRKHPRDYILTEYSEEIMVQIEPRGEGFLITCSKFPTIAALGPTEQEAIMTFKGLLFGYTYHLRTHEAELTPTMKDLFQRLKDIRVEM